MELDEATRQTFVDETSNPEKETRNVFKRDVLLAERVKAKAQSRGLAVYEVDGTLSAEEIATRIEQYCEPFLLHNS